MNTKKFSRNNSIKEKKQSSKNIFKRIVLLIKSIDNSKQKINDLKRNQVRNNKLFNYKRNS